MDDNTVTITRNLAIPMAEIQFEAIRAQGAGGQNVNKSATAVQLRFDIPASSLPEPYKTRLLALRDRRISKDGVLIIKAQESRSQEQNRTAALERFREIVRRATIQRKARKPTKASKAAKQRRLDSKKRRSEIKRLRRELPE